MSWLQIYALSLVVVMALVTLVWLLSLIKQDAGIMDIFWGLGFVIVTGWHFAVADGYPARRWLVLALVTVWGLRLSGHIFLRNLGRPEDYRYRTWREAAGRSFWWVSFFRVFALQGIILWLLAAPLLTAQFSPTPARLTVLDLLGALTWAVGFVFEAVADWQLMRFKSDPAHRGRLLRSGLWAYSRHPNYFGEAVIWWGYFLIALATPGGAWTVYSPVLMTWLLLRVSGVAMLEKALMESKPGYGDYVESTPAFFPWFPRKRQP